MGIQTLSAALAAQNLAIFLKTRATKVIPANTTTKPGESEQQSSTNTNTTVAAVKQEGTAVTVTEPETKQQQQQHEKMVSGSSDTVPGCVGSTKSIVTGKHQDLYATQHSLAELLHAMGKEEEANVLGQEIVNTYHPEDDEDNNSNDLMDKSDHHQEETTTLPATTKESKPGRLRILQSNRCC